MSQITYEASVYTRQVSYVNFKGETQTVELHFALDPLQLMQIVATGFTPKKVKSGNPARNGQNAEISDEEQLKFFRNLASKSAGTPSDDGESWEPFEDFENTLAGKAFLTRLAASDSDRIEFGEKVMIAPFEAFVKYAENDPSNSKQETQQLRTMLEQLRNILTPQQTEETLEEKRARLAAEMAALSASDS